MKPTILIKSSAATYTPEDTLFDDTEAIFDDTTATFGGAGASSNGKKPRISVK